MSDMSAKAWGSGGSLPAKDDCLRMKFHADDKTTLKERTPREIVDALNGLGTPWHAATYAKVHSRFLEIGVPTPTERAAMEADIPMLSEKLGLQHPLTLLPPEYLFRVGGLTINGDTSRFHAEWSRFNRVCVTRSVFKNHALFVWVSTEEDAMKLVGRRFKHNGQPYKCTPWHNSFDMDFCYKIRMLFDTVFH